MNERGLDLGISDHAPFFPLPNAPAHLQGRESQERWPEEYLPQSGVVCTDGWAGRIETPVTVTRRTPKRYECEYADGRRKLVPKYAVRFTPNATALHPQRSGGRQQQIVGNSELEDA